MKKFMLLFLLSGIVFELQAQELVSGIISGEFGTLEDANIIVKNSNRGTISNSNGYFEIKVVKGDVLMVSYLGYKTYEILVSNKNEFEIFLKRNETLDEVVVISYGVSKKIYCGSNCCPNTISCSVSSKEIKVENFIENLDESQMALFPNSSPSGLFNLKKAKAYKRLQVLVFNMSGQLIKQVDFKNIKRNVNIDLSQFPAGMYIVDIIANGKAIATKKAVKG